MICFILGIRSFSNKTTYLPSYRIFYLYATSSLISYLDQKKSP